VLDGERPLRRRRILSSLSPPAVGNGDLDRNRSVRSKHLSHPVEHAALYPRHTCLGFLGIDLDHDLVVDQVYDLRLPRTVPTVWPGLDWRFRLVHGVVAHPEELEAIRALGVETVEFADILNVLVAGDGEPVKTTSSTAADIAALIAVDRGTR
jgi:hypothetical protein